jgi:Nucleosome binding factor SPN, SPT16 subunit
MKDGASAREVYHHALSYVKEKKPELEKHFVKNVGFGVSQLPLALVFLQHYVPNESKDGGGIPRLGVRAISEK